jgi:hypothetical protein
MHDRTVPTALHEVFMTDATVSAALTYYLQGDSSLDEALMAAVVTLAREKAAALKSLEDLIMRLPPGFPAFREDRGRSSRGRPPRSPPLAPH